MTELELELPEISAEAAPGFSDVLTCKTWLEHVPLANVGEAQRQLLAEVAEFNRFPCRAAMRVQVLEALREAVAFVQIEQAKRFTNRALPMAEAEGAIFDATTALWEQMRIGYLHCLAASAAEESGMRAQAALLAQRVLAYTGLKIFHHYRAYREISAADWRALHRTYRCAEELAVAEAEVKDYLNRDVHEATPRIQYMRALLMALANPFELARRQLSFVAFLLERWSEKVDISAQPPAADGLPPLRVDIAGDKPPERLTGTGGAKIGDPRFLDASRLAKSLKNRIGLLRKGESPARLALGEDCVQPSCEQLLIFLYRQWCQPRQPRTGERKRIPEPAQVCNDMAGIHYYILGKVFRQPDAQTELTQKERNQIATFGRISTKDEDDYSMVHGFLLEHWQIEEESVTGLRMVRPAGSPGKRFSHGQLVAVRPGNAKNFMLAQARWLMQSNDGSLNAGLHLMAGLPAAISVRSYGLNSASEKYVAALTLTEFVALKSPPTLILPSGWYKPKRVIEVYAQQALRVKLGDLIDRGPDFERVSYEVMPD